MLKNLVFTVFISILLINQSQAQLGGLLKKKKDKDKEEKVETKNETAPANSGGDATASDDKTMKENKQAWENNFESNIDWFSLSSVGTLIVSTNGALFGVDGNDGKVLWKNEKFGNVQQDNFSMIDQSPYVAMVSGGLLNRQHTILNVLTGQVVADTREMGYKMVGKRYALPNQDGFVLSAYENNKSTIFFIDAPNAKEVWKLQDVFTKNNEVVNSRPLSVSENEFLIATDKNIYKLNSKEGKAVYSISFKTPNEALQTEGTDDAGITESTKADEEKGKGGGLLKRIPIVGGVTSAGSGMGNLKGQANKASTETAGKFFKIDNSERVYFFNNKYFAIIDEKAGKIIGEPFKFDDNIASFIPDSKGFVFATDEKKSELYYIDALTGQNKWGKGIELKGKINKITLNDGKIAVSSAKESEKNYINIIDANTGETVTKKDMSVKGEMMSLVITKRGLIYSTTDETNIQDPVTGKDVISKSLKYKTGGASVRKDGKFYVINDNEINAIDETTGEVTSFAKLDFKDKEDPQNIEVMSDGILVSSAQNMVMLGWDGKQKYHTFYKAPGTSLAGKILGGMAMAVAVGNAAAHGYAAGASGFGTVAYDDEMRKAKRWNNFGAAGASAFSKRFNMTAGTTNHQIIMSKIDDGEDKGFGLVKINKQTGTTEGKVVIGDKKPDYLFDEANGLIYYKNANKKITAFRL
jgi:outer membrane protein assembly factor BamB